MNTCVISAAKIIGFIAFIASIPVCSAQGQYPTPVGAVHADFEFPEIGSGKRHKLSDYRGKKVVLIHFASW